jgi:hypothetical protein
MNMTYAGFVKLGTIPKSHVIIVGGKNVILRMDVLKTIRYRQEVFFGGGVPLVYTTLAPNNEKAVESWQESVRGSDQWGDLGIIMLDGHSRGVTDAFLNSLKAQICIVFLDNTSTLGTDLKNYTFIDCGTVRGRKWELIERKFLELGIRTVLPGAKRILSTWPIEELVKFCWASVPAMVTEEFVNLFSMSCKKSIFDAVQDLLTHGRKKATINSLVSSVDNPQELLGVLYHELHCLIVMKTINKNHAHATALRFGIPAFKVKHYRDLSDKMELRDLYRHMNTVLELRLNFFGTAKELLSLLLSSW